MENNQLKYTLTIDPTPQHHKPQKKQMGTITNNLKMVTGLTIQEFATYSTQPYGYTWSGGIFSSSICNANWQSQSVFALDFDKGLVTIEQVLDRLKQREIYPQLWYSTFSDSDVLPKFRVVFFLDQPVVNQYLHKLIVTALLNLFPEADKQCKNAARIFLGGKQSFILNEEPIELIRFVEKMTINLIAGDSGKTRKIPPELFNAITNSVSNCALVYNINRSIHFETKITSISTTTPQFKLGGEVIDFGLARQRVKIFDAFLAGEWLFHDELFGLATNMQYIRGGRKLMTSTMESFNKAGVTNYTEDNFSIFTYLNKVTYEPRYIHSFSPYPEDEFLYDLISATKDIRGHIDQIESINRMTLYEAETMFKSKFEEVMSDSTLNKIHLFIVPTALGKTEQITSSVGIIALPTNDLKNEVMERMKIPCVSTPDSVVFDNMSINRNLDYYYSIGLPKKATAVLYDVVNPSNAKRYSESDIQKANQYISDLKTAYYSKFSVLTTHSRALLSEYNHDTIIFDEDPLSSLLSIKQVSISDVQKLDNQLMMLDSDLGNVISFLKSINPGEVVCTPLYDMDLDELINKVKVSTIQTNIFDFFSSSYLMKDKRNGDLIHYVVKRELPKNKKIIILSATLPIFIYQKLFGDKLNVINIKDVEQQGEIIQYTNRSCSRKYLSKYVSNISQTVGNKPVITFKAFQKDFQNPVDGIYFGKCSGSDKMKGQDLVVVGTPHRNNNEYLLLAKALGIDFKTTDTTMTVQKIEYNGFRFKMNCYDNEELRNIQLALIESDLIQAVGRARTLREKATVQVYSNFPLRISGRFIF